MVTQSHIPRWPRCTHDTYMFINSSISDIFEIERVPNIWLLGWQCISLQAIASYACYNPRNASEGCYMKVCFNESRKEILYLVVKSIHFCYAFQWNTEISKWNRNLYYHCWPLFIFTVLKMGFLRSLGSHVYPKSVKLQDICQKIHRGRWRAADTACDVRPTATESRTDYGIFSPPIYCLLVCLNATWP